MDKGLPLEAEILALAQEVDAYRVMLGSTGFKNLDAEIELYVADLLEKLSACDLEHVRGYQGQIEALRWLRSLPDEAAQRLEGLQKANKAEATE